MITKIREILQSAVQLGLLLMFLLPSVSYAQVGEVNVVTVDYDAVLYMDDDSVGIVNFGESIQLLDVPAGEHLFRLSKSGHKDSVLTIEILADEVHELAYSLVELAELSISTNKSGIHVYIDNEYVGDTDAEDANFSKYLEPGTHVFEGRLEQHITDRDTIVMNENGLTQYRSLTLVPIPAETGLIATMLEVFSDPIALVLLIVLVSVMVAVGWVFYNSEGGASSTGVKFDRYELIKLLGRGGIAAVYLAKDKEDDGAEVALKIMDPGLLHDADLVRKFLKEGEVLRRINNSYPLVPVVKVFRHGRENGLADGRPFVALEYIEGENLFNFLKRKGRLNVDLSLSVLEQICNGLLGAHANKIWHRDVTPDNIIVTSAAPIKIKLIDFGIAKHEYTSTSTLDGSITGKPPYMSPEQCRGESIDGRSDIYSLGILMYTMVIGRPPFTNNNPLMVMKMHETQIPPAMPNEVDEDVRLLVMKMLEKDREKRPVNIVEVLKVIEGINAGNASVEQQAT